MRGHRNRVWTVAFSPDRKTLASVSGDASVRLWNADTGAPLRELKGGHQATISGLAYNPHGDLFATAANGRTARLWDAKAGEPIGFPIDSFGNGLAVAFSPDGTKFAVGTEAHAVELWPAVFSPDDLCAKLTRNMTDEQWKAWVAPDISPEKPCTALP